MSPMSKRARYLVLALGNDLLGDDAVALHLARRLRGALPDQVDVVETAETGLALLDFLVGYDYVFILDAIEMDQPDGKLRLIMDAYSTTPSGVGVHFLGIPDVLRLQRALQLDAPAKVMLVGIPIAPQSELREGLSDAVARQMPEWTKAIQGLIEGQIAWRGDLAKTA